MAINPSFVGYGAGQAVWVDTTNTPQMFMAYSGGVGFWNRGIIEISKSNISAPDNFLLFGAKLKFKGIQEGSRPWNNVGKISLWKSDVPRDTYPYPDNSELDLITESGETIPRINVESEIDISSVFNDFFSSNDSLLRIIVGFANESELPKNEGLNLDNIEVELIGISPPQFISPTSSDVIKKSQNNGGFNINWNGAEGYGIDESDLTNMKYSLYFYPYFNSNPDPNSFTRLKDAPTNISTESYYHYFGKEGERRWPRTQLMLSTQLDYKGSPLEIPHTFSDSFEVDNRLEPNKSTNLSPDNNENRNAESPIELSWQFNDDNVGDYQTAYEIRYKIIENTKWREVSAFSQETSHTLPARSLPLGNYEWQVRVRDSTSLWSDWSDVVYFTASDIGNAPNILTPGEFTDEKRPLVTWHDLDQSHFQVKVEQSGVLVWDSGEVTTSDNEVRIGVDLDGETEYVISLRIKREDGLWSSWNVKTVTTDFSIATKPSLNIYELNHGIRLVVKGEAYRYNIYKFMDNDWVKIATMDASESDIYEDLFVASGQEYLYRASSQTAGGNETFSDVISGQITFNGAYIHSINDSETLHFFKYGGNKRAIERGVEHAYRQFVGRKRPTIVYGTQQSKSITTNLQIKLDSGDDKALEQYLYNRQEVCYRDGRGELIIGSFTEFPLNYEVWGWLSQITITETDFSEVIE